MMPGSAPRVVIAHEQALFRAAMRSALETDGGLEIAGEAADTAAVARVLGSNVDLLLLDAELPPGDAIDACARAKRDMPDTKVLVLGPWGDASVLMDAVDAGSDGYVTRDMDLTTLIGAARQVLGGQAYVPPAMLGALLHGLIERNRKTEALNQLFMKLTKREREIVELVGEGCDHATVADILVISPQTARTHIQNIMHKLGVHSRLEVAALAMDYGLVRGDSPRRGALR